MSRPFAPVHSCVVLFFQAFPFGFTLRIGMLICRKPRCCVRSAGLWRSVHSTSICHSTVAGAQYSHGSLPTRFRSPHSIILFYVPHLSPLLLPPFSFPLLYPLHSTFAASALSPHINPFACCGRSSLSSPSHPHLLLRFGFPSSRPPSCTRPNPQPPPTHIRRPFLPPLTPAPLIFPSCSPFLFSPALPLSRFSLWLSL